MICHIYSCYFLYLDLSCWLLVCHVTWYATEMLLLVILLLGMPCYVLLCPATSFYHNVTISMVNMQHRYIMAMCSVRLPAAVSCYFWLRHVTFWYVILLLLLLLLLLNLIYMAQFDTNCILTVLYSHNTHTNAICAHMNIHETIIFMHMYKSTHKHIHHHMYKYISTDIQTRLPILI